AKPRGVPCRDKRDFVRSNLSARRLDTGHRTVTAAQEPRHLGVFDDVDAAIARAGGESPCHAVMTSGPAPALQRAAEHRVPGAGGDVDDRAELLDLLCVEHLGVDALEMVGFDEARRAPDLVATV